MSKETGGEKKAVVFKKGDPKLVAALRKRIESDPNKYTQRYVGAQVGALTTHGTYSGSYVSTYLSKGWTGDEFEPALREWLDQDKAERGRQRKELFLRNSITDQVMMWLDYCTSNGKCVALTGDAGIGKTETLDYCLAGKRGVFRIQAGPLRNQARHLMNVLKDTIGEDHPAFDMASNPADGIARFFVQYSFAIVVDDFDLLIPSAYEFLLRDLWNQTRIADKTVPIFLAGNIEGVRHLRKLSPQLASRVRHVDLNVKDAFKLPLVRQFMEHHLGGIELSNDMIKAGVRLANAPDLGHLRALFDVCQETKYLLKLDDEEDAETTFFDVLDQNTQAARQPLRRTALAQGRPQEVSRRGAPAVAEAMAGRELVEAAA